MYNFRKIKSAKSILQYQHQYFCQGVEENLKLISRNRQQKKKSLPKRKKTSSNRLPLREEIAKLRNQIEEMQKVRDEMSKQNKRLIESNKETYVAICNARYSSLRKCEKLLFIFLSLVYRPSDGLRLAMILYLIKPEACQGPDTLAIISVLNRIKMMGVGLVRELLNQSSSECPLWDELLKFVQDSPTQENRFPVSDDLARHLSELTQLIHYDNLIIQLTKTLQFEDILCIVANTFKEVENSITTKDAEESLLSSSYDNLSS